MPAPWLLPSLNQHGVEVIAGVPLVCCACPLLEEGEFDEWTQRWVYPFCSRGVFMPVQKGTCRVSEKYLLTQADDVEARTL